MKMLLSLILVEMLVLVLAEDESPSGQQLVNFKRNTKGPIGTMTTSNGAPIESRDANSSLNQRLIYNEYFIDSLTHVVRERIPERIVHAKAGGAFGYFEVTHNITGICKADLFSEVGKKTRVGARFSPLGADKGGLDNSRDARGFGIKFYTNEGNFDIAGFNTPMYFYKDPIVFPSFVRTQKRNPATNLIDMSMLWDILNKSPESFHLFLYLLGDRGIPDGYRHMPGFGIHTFQVVNKYGEINFIRFHFYPEAGIKNLLNEEVAAINDPDYATRDLYDAIEKGEYPSWSVEIQILTPEDVKTAGFDVFDVTKVLPEKDYPLIKLGKLVLNENPINYHAQIEQMALCPCNLVPGILGAPDTMFEARRFAYRDAQYHRLGANFNRIPVNCPLHSGALTYNRNGAPPVDDNMRDVPNYYPNSFNGPAPYTDNARAEMITIVQDAPNNYDQSIDLYTNQMTKEERSRVVENAVARLESATKEIQDNALVIFSLINTDLASQISQRIQSTTTNTTTTDTTTTNTTTSDTTTANTTTSDTTVTDTTKTNTTTSDTTATDTTAANTTTTDTTTSDTTVTDTTTSDTEATYTTTTDTDEV